MRKHPGILLLFLLVLGTLACNKSKDDPIPPPVVAGSSSHIMFWVSTYFNSPIPVTCNGETKNITIYHYGEAPECGAGGNATFDLDPGTYAITAINGAKTYLDTITVAEGECKKIDLDSIPFVASTNAILMSGGYSGTTQFLPGQIDLGTLAACDSVAYVGHLHLGSANLVVTAVSDTSISLQFSSALYPTITFPNVPIQRTGQQINFANGYYGVDNRHLYFFGFTPNSTYQTTDACLIQLPYVYGWDPNGTGFDYKTIEHLEFFGVQAN